MAYEGSDNNALTISSAESWFKRWYIDNGNLDGLMYQDKFLGRLKRLPATTNTAGNKIIVPVRVGRNPNQSKTFSSAQNAAKARTGAREEWQLDTSDFFGVIRVSDKSILASRNNRGAFVEMLTDEADSALEGLAQKWCTSLFSTVDNAVGKVGSVSGANITLKQPADVVNLDINDQIELRVPGSGSLRAGGSAYVTKIRRDTGVITTSAAISGAAADDDVFRVGDYGKTAVTSFDDYIPTAAPTSTLNGIDRSIDPIRLGGHRIAMSATDKFDSVVRKMASRIMQLTGKVPTIAVMNPLVDQVVSEELTDKIRYSNNDGKGAGMSAMVGQGPLSFKTGGGEIETVLTPFAPLNRFYLLNEADVGLYYLAEEGGDLVFFKKNPETGGIFKLSHDSAGIEARAESYGNLGLKNPGLHGVISLHSGKVPSLA